MRTRLSVTVLAALALGCEHPPGGSGSGEADREERTTRGIAESIAERLRGDRGSYPLDDRARRVSKEGELDCPEVELVRYRGEELSFGEGGVRVAPPFREKLRELERIAVEVGERVMGRPPEAIEHFGAYSCRRVRERPYRLSEHAFGNAIDVAGFRFGPAPREARDQLPRSLWWRTTVSVADDWVGTPDADTKDGARALRARFLRELVDALIEQDVFRAMLGPADPGHENHFHFDHGPWSYRIV